MTHVDIFSVCRACYEISVLKISLSNNCTVNFISLYRPPYSQVYYEIGWNFVINFSIWPWMSNNLQSNSFIPLINEPTHNVDNNSSILDHIWSNELYNTFSGIFLADITHHYTQYVFTIVPLTVLDRPQKRIRVRYLDHSWENLAKRKLEVKHYLNNHLQINQDVSFLQIISVMTDSLSIVIVI